MCELFDGYWCIANGVVPLVGVQLGLGYLGLNLTQPVLGWLGFRFFIIQVGLGLRDDNPTWLQVRLSVGILSIWPRSQKQSLVWWLEVRTWLRVGPGLGVSIPWIGVGLTWAQPKPFELQPYPLQLLAANGWFRGRAENDWMQGYAIQIEDSVCKSNILLLSFCLFLFVLIGELFRAMGFQKETWGHW